MDGLGVAGEVGGLHLRDGVSVEDDDAPARGWAEGVVEVVSVGDGVGGAVVFSVEVFAKLVPGEVVELVVAYGVVDGGGRSAEGVEDVGEGLGGLGGVEVEPLSKLSAVLAVYEVA